jgi:cell division protein FtsN
VTAAMIAADQTATVMMIKINVIVVMIVQIVNITKKNNQKIAFQKNL